MPWMSSRPKTKTMRGIAQTQMGNLHFKVASSFQLISHATSSSSNRNIGVKRDGRTRRGEFSAAFVGTVNRRAKLDFASEICRARARSNPFFEAGGNLFRGCSVSRKWRPDSRSRLENGGGINSRVKQRPGHMQTCPRLLMGFNPNPHRQGWVETT